MIDQLVNVNPFIPYIAMLCGILFLVYAVREPRYNINKQGFIESQVEGSVEPIVYLYLTFAAGCFTMFG